MRFADAHGAAPRAAEPAAFWRDPALPFAESRRACHSRACYKPHHHPAFSIGAVDAGRSVFTGAADGPVVLTPGTLVFVPAARVHACNPAPGVAWSYQMLHLEAAWLQGVRQEYACAGFDADEPVRIVTDPLAYAGFCQLNALLFRAAEPGDKEAALIEFIGDCDLRQGVSLEAPRTPARLAAQIGPALALLRDEPAVAAPLSHLAQLAGLSRYQLIRAFRAVTGMPPHAWQLNHRINLARAALRAGAPLADLAQRLGFADQAHFQRVFKAHAGVTPGRFRG
ncbi:MAG: AraC family transcriptional regulator [Candidatus Dactylopiibacterium sp.]|nr:AraC family transcriptional regulator [Candidatus Dactylopiibacterium sp.]